MSHSKYDPDLIEKAAKALFAARFGRRDPIPDSFDDGRFKDCRDDVATVLDAVADDIRKAGDDLADAHAESARNYHERAVKAEEALRDTVTKEYHDSLMQDWQEKWAAEEARADKAETKRNASEWQARSLRGQLTKAEDERDKYLKAFSEVFDQRDEYLTECKKLWPREEKYEEAQETLRKIQAECAKLKAEDDMTKWGGHGKWSAADTIERILREAGIE